MARNTPTKPSTTKEFTGKVALLDMHSLREATDVLVSEERVSIDFGNLKSILENVPAAHKWEARGWVDTELHIASLSIDTKSEAQQRLSEALGRHFEVDESYYRDNFVSTPAGRHPAEVFDKEKGLRPFISLAPRLAYAIGRLSRYDEPQVLVVTHCFELFYPLVHLAQSNQGARVGLAFFSSLLDHRWKQAGLLTEGSPIDFFDLDPFASQILGGIQLTERRAAQPPPKRTGIDRL